MEVKITTKKLADIMMANYKEEVPMLSDSAESEIRGLLGDEFVNEAYTEFKNTVAWMNCPRIRSTGFWCWTGHRGSLPHLNWWRI